ncbi:glucose-6-phosphate dehydrogenase [Dictyoglomus thermophilum]|uniref:Glucose-6-phosphate 1-dehydrogenase n=1 Tax=Dictyoglomus thermophilum (strain ATCC 35947 / DSM 3960 / H-6-12) TaxID=309799 RepID=B5YB42_DICT6|nr:glucose-6-phosphate dehydrogenase [Dictyoglomus thermophilum]ACI19202.1 glucose-6-phosphate 1-dehydrogenase [Dictyoglomus thermophilum H-6-12]
MNNKFIIILFGGLGDLAKNKIYPVLYSLFKKYRLLNCTKIISTGRRPNIGKEEFLKILENSIKTHDENFFSLFDFVRFDLEKEEEYNNLKNILSNFKEEEFIFYLATPPTTFETIIKNLGDFLKAFPNKRKIVIEKPFGYDLYSAQKLNRLIKDYFKEEEIYRIDHFLGKETVQNIFGLRFSNIIFEGIWNRNFIDHIQISALEDIGVEGRLGYYDKVGALRDMIQNHLIQILSIVAMEPPCCIKEKEIRDEKVKVLKSIREIKAEEVPLYAVRGQYEGYLKDEGISQSNTETYAAVKFFIENLRWDGVPFYLRTGKKLKRKETSVIIVFKKIPGLFSKILDCMPQEDTIGFKIAPENKIILNFQLRPLGGNMLSCPVSTKMEWTGPNIEAYETLFIDIIEGDQSLFIREDEIEKSWEIVQPILDFWKEDPNIPIYPQGSWGPKEAEELIRRDGREWRYIDE